MGDFAFSPPKRKESHWDKNPEHVAIIKEMRGRGEKTETIGATIGLPAKTVASKLQRLGLGQDKETFDRNRRINPDRPLTNTERSKRRLERERAAKLQDPDPEYRVPPSPKRSAPKKVDEPTSESPRSKPTLPRLAFLEGSNDE